INYGRFSSYVVIFVFFFSSRRRHTRCYRDWSSDVCSSDLKLWIFCAPQFVTFINEIQAMPGHGVRRAKKTLSAGFLGFMLEHQRSEERRVGKECRFWWSTYHYK